MKTFKILLFSVFFVIVSCNKNQRSNNFKVNFEKFELENGLDVVFHIDKSDPIVAVELMVHVGSSREEKGRTGFAHLFEHLLFLESENLGKGGLDKMSARIGGSGANGSTSPDRTNYLQTVPNDALEKMIWAEADKLGWFINTVTDPVLEKEKQVVKNEKRQSVDNRPYGHNQYVIGKNLYPDGHPYSWQVIGSLEDLQSATLDDVKRFFNKWYVPNNSTLVISGDFDTKKAKEWVIKYFDEIPRGDDIVKQKKWPANLEKNKNYYYEDNFARQPLLTMVWPTVEQYHPDSYALDVLSIFLSEGKSAFLNKILIDDLKLTSSVRMSDNNYELAGNTQISVRAFKNINLNDVKNGIIKAFKIFEENGISEKDLNRIKAEQETNFYSRLSSVLGKGTNLAYYNTFTGNPGFINVDIKNKLSVTTKDVNRVYEKYIKGRPFLTTSFVPKNKTDLAIENSLLAKITEEKIIQGHEIDFDTETVVEFKKTPSKIDRSQEPPYGNKPIIRVPEIYRFELNNGMKVSGIENSEVPLVRINIYIEGGQLHEKENKIGLSYLTARLMNKGTKNKNTEELQQEIKNLGSTISFSSDKEGITIVVNTLSKNYRKTLAIVEEMILEPRFDVKEFELIKKSIVSTLVQQQANPNSISRNLFNELIYGQSNIRSKNIIGSMNDVEEIKLDDVEMFYNEFLSPTVTSFLVVGDIDKDEVSKSLKSLESNWSAKNIYIPKSEKTTNLKTPAIYFYDVPNAKQSIIRVGSLALSINDDDFYPATVMNYILGGGGFASRLTQELRESKGYTYGINSSFTGTKAKGPFSIFTQVRTNVTLESLQLIKKILEEYPSTFNQGDLKTTKSFLLKSSARAFETSYAKMSILSNISNYNMNLDYLDYRKKTIEEITISDIKKLANKYVDPKNLIWVVVGDSKTQLGRLKELGFGEPILLN